MVYKPLDEDISNIFRTYSVHTGTALCSQPFFIFATIAVSLNRRENCPFSVQQRIENGPGLCSEHRFFFSGDHFGKLGSNLELTALPYNLSDIAWPYKPNDICLMSISWHQSSFPLHQPQTHLGLRHTTGPPGAVMVWIIKWRGQFLEIFKAPLSRYVLV